MTKPIPPSISRWIEAPIPYYADYTPEQPKTEITITPDFHSAIEKALDLIPKDDKPGSGFKLYKSYMDKLSDRITSATDGLDRFTSTITAGKAFKPSETLKTASHTFSGTKIESIIVDEASDTYWPTDDDECSWKPEPDTYKFRETFQLQVPGTPTTPAKTDPKEPTPEHYGEWS